MRALRIFAALSVTLFAAFFPALIAEPARSMTLDEYHAAVSAATALVAQDQAVVDSDTAAVAARTIDLAAATQAAVDGATVVTAAQTAYDNSSIPVTTSSGSGIHVDIYNNSWHTFSPNPSNLCRSDTFAQIAANWGNGSVAGCDNDHVTIHYTGTITVPDSGSYRFMNIADDGFYMSLDGQNIINDWRDKGCGGSWSQPVQLAAGSVHTFDAWYYENAGGACSTLYVTQPSGNWQVVPASWFGQTSTVTYKKDDSLLPAIQSAQANEDALNAAVTSVQTALNLASSKLATDQATLSADIAALNAIPVPLPEPIVVVQPPVVQPPDSTPTPDTSTSLSQQPTVDTSTSQGQSQDSNSLTSTSPSSLSDSSTDVSQAPVLVPTPGPSDSLTSTSDSSPSDTSTTQTSLAPVQLPVVDTSTVTSDTSTASTADANQNQAPTPQPSPQPAPEPAVTPAPQPQPVPRPEPVAAPPTPTPAPSPSAEPSPAPSPSPTPAPVASASPEPAPTPTDNASPTPAPSPEPTPAPSPTPQPTPAPQPTPEPSPATTPSPQPTPPAVAPTPEPSSANLIPDNPNSLSDTVPSVPPAEVLVAHVQEDKAGVENGGIQFFGTKSQPQVVGEDGKLTPPAPPPGSGLPIPPDAVTTTATFIGQPGGTTFNAPDIAVPVVETPVKGALAAVPGVQALNHALVSVENIGNDMSPVTRKKAKKILVATLVAGQIAQLRRRF